MPTAIETRPLNAQGPITTVEELRVHLYHAAQLELSTIPLYLYAAYSIKTQSYSQWAPGVSALRAVRSVVIEEMLHLALVRNLMVAVGGADEIRFYDADFIPTYPSPMLHRIPELMLQLEPCSKDLMQRIFMPLELPQKTDAPPEPDRYHTIGQFYAAIKDGFERLAAPSLFAANRPELQYYSGYWNQDGGGSPVVVCDLTSALAAITTVVEQGEGVDPDRALVPLDPIHPTPGLNELSHYAKFRRIAEGIDGIGETWPLPTNPRTSEFQGSTRKLAELFNAAYSYVLCMIDAIYHSSRESRAVGHHSERYGLERTLMSAMGGILFPIADLLVRLPAEKEGGLSAAPTFEFYPFDSGAPKKQQLLDLCDELVGEFPSLGGDDGVRVRVSLLSSV